MQFPLVTRIFFVKRKLVYINVMALIRHLITWDKTWRYRPT